MRARAAAVVAAAGLAGCGGEERARSPAATPAATATAAATASPSPAGTASPVPGPREPAAPAPPAEIVAYRESGAWARDIEAVIARARRVLATRATGRPAIVLDVDDTSLSTYECLKAVGFDRARARCAESGDLPAIEPTLALYRRARRDGVTVFFVTGRREGLRAVTLANLRAAGYRGRLRLTLRPEGQRGRERDGYKARARAAIERRGHRIVVNLGDQASDLDGGHALRAFKLPNPMYVIEDA